MLALPRAQGKGAEAREARDENSAGALQEGDRGEAGPPGLQWGSGRRASALAQGGDRTFQGRSNKLGTRRPVLPSSDQHEGSIGDTEGDGDSAEDRCRASASRGRHHEQSDPKAVPGKFPFTAQLSA